MTVNMFGFPIPNKEQWKRIKEIIRGSVPTEDEKAWLQPLGWWPGDQLIGTADKAESSKQIDVVLVRPRHEGSWRKVEQTTKPVRQQTWFPS